MEFTDRYAALGIPYPDQQTMCREHCEGTGWVPISEGETDPVFCQLWMAAHRKSCLTVFGWRKIWHQCDGWHFVKCPSCNGTGKAEHDAEPTGWVR